jgi:hypothetical protein
MSTGAASLAPDPSNQPHRLGPAACRRPAGRCRACALAIAPCRPRRRPGPAPPPPARQWWRPLAPITRAGASRCHSWRRTSLSGSATKASARLPAAPIAEPLAGLQAATATARAHARAWAHSAAAHTQPLVLPCAGCWGSVISATQQGWFLGPEPPVSRGLLRRLCMPWAPGVDHAPPRQARRGSAAALLDCDGAAAVEAEPGAGGHAAESGRGRADGTAGDVRV